MSGARISVGSKYKGDPEGKVVFEGKNIVEPDKESTYDIGSTATGDVKEKATLSFKETNEVKNTIKEENVDSKTEPSAIGKYKLENEKQIRIGSEVQVTHNTKDVGFEIKGHMTIFNQDKNRYGSANDVKSLTTTFKKFGILPTIKSNLKIEDIIKEIHELSTKDFSSYKLFVCVYMSHGNANGIVSAADKDFKLKETIIYPILRNKTLNGIHKIFITVACRGNATYEKYDIEEYDGNILSTADHVDYSKCIISYSTYEGHVSLRRGDGTYFIQHLCDNINEGNGETKIHSLFAQVNGKQFKEIKVLSDFNFSFLFEHSGGFWIGEKTMYK